MGLRVQLPGLRLGAVALLIGALPTAQLEAVQTRATDYEVAVVADGAGLTGTASFSGDVPDASELLITRDFEVCGLGYRERREVDVGETGGLRSVVVYITGMTSGKPWPEAPEGYLLDQLDCFFEPYIQVVPRGTDLQIENSDPILHNVHGYELMGPQRKRTLFNLGQPDKGIISRPLRLRRSQQVGLECDAHDFMLGWLFAANNPYAVVVDSVGKFTISDIPPGTYAVGAWHPFLGVMEQEVTVAPGTANNISFEFRED